ncbi:hypothetical protein BDU57DRAFT_240190 [Ampelomyces quisqualis]|uniref:Uncharacterized protein n=1 Tax=Ampelomyces quisqualis TaxID=50730 RepID=A0A6A5QPN2_AMPQU|nr:hypothetical protein BDU57DRAFT_240190 [Ampelomyces quisqualis]
MEPSSQTAANFKMDSALSHIWLLSAACAMFECFQPFTDADLEPYLANETTHLQLLEENPSFNSILTSRSGAPFRLISLAYSSFDLQLSPPLVEKTMSCAIPARTSFLARDIHRLRQRVCH